MILKLLAIPFIIIGGIYLFVNIRADNNKGILKSLLVLGISLILLFI